jgi:hypothetical protein
MMVLLSGYKGSGKDALAKELVEKYGYRRIALADILKNMVADQYGLSEKQLHDQSLKETALKQYPVEMKDAFSEHLNSFLVGEFRTANGQIPSIGGVVNNDGQLMMVVGDGELQQLFWTPRALCILEGSVKRSADSNYWVKRAVHNVELNEKIVISDFRYKSEHEAIGEAMMLKNSGIITVRIDRFSESPSSDPSERDLDNFVHNITIKNDSSLEDFLSRGVKAILDQQAAFEVCSWV